MQWQPRCFGGWINSAAALDAPHADQTCFKLNASHCFLFSIVDNSLALKKTPGRVDEGYRDFATISDIAGILRAPISSLRAYLELR